MRSLPCPCPGPPAHTSPPLCPTYILKSFRTLSLPHLTHTTSCLGKVCFLHIKSLLLSWGRGTLSSPSMCPELRMSSELSKWRKNKAGLNHLSLLSPAFLHPSLTHQNHTWRAWSPIRGDYILKRKAIWMDQSEKAWLIFGKTSPKTQTCISNTQYYLAQTCGLINWFVFRPLSRTVSRRRTGWPYIMCAVASR